MSAKNMDEIAELFQNLKFKKVLFGGVKEIDVWKQLDRIQKEYRSAYETQQACYEARLMDREKEIASLRKQISEETDHE